MTKNCYLGARQLCESNQSNTKMTTAHILYIPTIFLLGFLAGSLFGKAKMTADSPTGTGSVAKNPKITGRLLLASFVIFLAVFIGTHFFEIPRSSKAVAKALNGVEIFDKHPSYSSSEVYARLAAFPPAGRALYQQFTYTIDVLFPLTLFIFLLLLALFILERYAVKGKAARVLVALLPVLWFGSDMVENAMIYRLLSMYPVHNNAMAGILGYITISKFSLLLLCVLVPAGTIALRKRRN